MYALGTHVLYLLGDHLPLLRFWDMRLSSCVRSWRSCFVPTRGSLTLVEILGYAPEFLRTLLALSFASPAPSPGRAAPCHSDDEQEEDPQQSHPHYHQSITEDAQCASINRVSQETNRIPQKANLYLKNTNQCRLSHTVRAGYTAI